MVENPGSNARSTMVPSTPSSQAGYAGVPGQQAQQQQQQQQQQQLPTIGSTAQGGRIFFSPESKSRGFFSGCEGRAQRSDPSLAGHNPPIPYSLPQHSMKQIV